MWIALLAWSPPPKNLQKSVIGEAYKIGPSFIAVPMMMSGSLYKEIGGMATGQEGVAMVRVWHQGWIFGVIKVYIVTLNSHHKNYVNTVEKSIVWIGVDSGMSVSDGHIYYLFWKFGK